MRTAGALAGQERQTPEPGLDLGLSLRDETDDGIGPQVLAASPVNVEAGRLTALARKRAR